MKENEHILRATKSEHHEAVYWKDGGLDIKIEDKWFTRLEDNYAEADSLRSKWLDGIKKEDVRVRK